MAEVPPEKLAEWQRTWEAVGAARVAEELATGRMSNIVDEIGRTGKREFARKWLTERLEKNETDRRRTGRRATVAIWLSIASFIATIILHFL